ncbi:MAG: hypothetical protein ACKVS7_09025 [Gemmatimonadaceae bacterium]
MPWFPVLPDEVAATEARLGIALPLGYRAIVGDPKMRVLLAHPTVGAIDLAVTMAEFAGHTERRRTTLKDFPAKAVVAMEGDGRYIRFWLPDPKRPGVLGETIYAWDIIEAKQSKDASGLGILKSMLQLAAVQGREVPRAPAPLPFEVVAHAIGAAGSGDWHDCGEWTLQGSYITVTDLGEMPESDTPSTVKLAPGVYRMAVRRRPGAAGGGETIAAWRMLRGDVPGVRGADDVRHIADVAVDLAAVAVYDRQTFFARVRPAAREGFVSRLMDVQPALAALRVREVTPLQVVRSGEGDGTYPLHVFLAGTERIGVMLTFLDY